MTNEENLCKDCMNLCNVVQSDTNETLLKNQCFIRIDSGAEYDPITEVGCPYFVEKIQRAGCPCS